MKNYDECANEGRYTPDPGEVETEQCGICDSEMDVERNVDGPRGYAQAMGGGKSLHDVFSCPHVKENWHIQAKKLRQAARKTPSGKLAEMLMEEAREIVRTRKATKEVSEYS